MLRYDLTINNLSDEDVQRIVALIGGNVETDNDTDDGRDDEDDKDDEDTTDEDINNLEITNREALQMTSVMFLNLRQAIQDKVGRKNSNWAPRMDDFGRLHFDAHIGDNKLVFNDLQELLDYAYDELRK